MSNTRCFIPALALVVIATSQPSQAATFSLNPVADSFVTTGPSNNLRDNNYGNAGGLSVSAPGSATGEFQSALRFDALAARNSFDALFGPGQWMLQSVSLQLTAVSPNNAIFNANAAGSFTVSWMQNDVWAEGSGGPGNPSTTGISYNLLTGSIANSGTDESLGTFGYNGGTGASTYALSLGAGLSSDLQNGSAISLRLLAADAAVSFVANSRNFTTVENRPLLTFEAVAVPEPATTAFVGILLTLFVAIRSTREKR